MLKKRLGIEAIERDGCKRTCFKISSTLIIPESVERIGESAFWNCCKLKKVVIPKSVVEIGEYAFCGCIWLGKVEIPGSVVKIEYAAFKDCWKATIILKKKEEDFEKIGLKAFENCKDVKEEIRD